MQYCAFSILTENDPVTIVLVYRPPNSGSKNNDELCKLTRNLPRNTILIGDFNFPKIDWLSGTNGSGGGTFFAAAQETGLEQLVDFATHKKGNILDLFLTNMYNNIISFRSSAPLRKVTIV